MRSSLYVHRPLVNVDQLRKWATQQGFGSLIDPGDIHVTIAFSKRPLGWDNLEPNQDHLRVVGGDRIVEPLGDRGAIVLRFEDPHLSDRWDEFCRAGADWEHPDFKPHITLTYDGGDLDPSGIDPYLGPLIFGPEEFAPVEEDWDQGIEEIPLVAENVGLFPSKSCQAIKYAESITEITRMTDFSSLLIKNIDLILEAYNVDESGNLVVANKKKVREADEVFHQYFVKSMNNMFRQINEADPILQDPQGMGLPQHGIDNLGLGGDEMMGDMHAGHPGMGHPGMGHPGMEMDHDGMGMGDEQDGLMGDHMGHHPMHQQHDPAMGGGSMGAMAGGFGESADYNWLSEDPDMDIDALFDLKEDEEQLDEFMGHPDDEMMGDEMDHMGGANDMGGDMGGMGDADPMSLDSGMDHHGGMMGGGDEMGDDGDMVTVHGTTDNGADFEFSFDPNTLGFDDLEGGGDMGGDMSDQGGDFGGHEEHHDENGGDMGGGFGGHEEHEHEHHGMGEEEEEPVAEGMVKKGKPGKGNRGPKTSRMAVVPDSPQVGHAAPFPTPQGQRQKRK